MLATKFAVAVHVMLLLCVAEASAEDDSRTHLLTSAKLGASVNTNPVVIRRITGQLARAGLVRVHRGRGGAELGIPKEQITLDKIWRAVHPDDRRRLLPLHPPPVGDDPAVKAHEVVDRAFREAEAHFRASLGQVALASLAAHLHAS